jgi:hypothetical protein
VHDLQEVCLQGLPEGKQNSQQNIQIDHLQGLLDEDGEKKDLGACLS